MKTRIVLALLLCASLAALAFQAARTPVPVQSLTAYVPQDALLSIESPDFASLLHRWTNSPESKAWLGSDHYSVFTNSRLFGRLSDAQATFAEAAGLPPKAELLQQIAGTQSVFAWYDVGNLEFLYITRMPAAQAGKTQLLQSRARFERRQVGKADFYIRTRGINPARTVAFAQVPSSSGDLLLLATREDLIANALTLIADSKGGSLQQEPWFADASAELLPERKPPALHMVLNLDRIVPLPYFRSYWVQQNITWMNGFRSAASDLYLEPARFREERVLLAKASIQPRSSTYNLAALARLVPPGSGVFRALSTTDSNEAVDAIASKLLGKYTPDKASALLAEDPSLIVRQAGTASDLETRIDTPAPLAESASSQALAEVVASARLDGLLTLSSALPPSTPNGVWVPIHSAVVLHGGASWNPQTLASALQQSLHGSLTTSTLGIVFKPSAVASSPVIYSLNGPRPLFFAVSASENLAFLSDDQPLLLSLLVHPTSALPAQMEGATLIAGFDHTGQRLPYARLTSLIDGTNNAASKTPAVRTINTAPDASAAPTFFSQEMRSLSDTFAALDSEQVVERTVNADLRQTVTYNWHTP